MLKFSIFSKFGGIDPDSKIYSFERIYTMAKFIIAATLTIQIENYSHGRPCLQMEMTMSYSLRDIIEIIKMYTDYTDTYDWSFRNPYEENKNLSLAKNKEQIENTSFSEYRNITPYVICYYGPIEIHLGVRGFKKYTKVYPTIYQAVGKFPTEEEFAKNIKISDIDGKYTIPRKPLPSTSHVINDDLIEYGERLKEYFKSKYKISDEIDESSTFKNNKLARI